MRIFVAGATGAVGRPLVRALVSAGHSVAGPTRSAAKVEAIKRMGAEPVVADGLDAASIRTAVVSVRPEITIHEMTDLGNVMDLRHLERTVTSSADPDGIVLRYGAFYGPDTGMLAPAMIGQLRHRRVPLIGDGAGCWSFIHVDDAASATAAAIERGRAGNIYNIVDDEPAEVSEWLPALAGMLGAKPPLHVPAWIGRIVAGEHMVAMMTQVRAGSNAKAKRELGWHPAHSSWRFGFA